MLNKSNFAVFLVLFSCLLPILSHATDTRGLRVVAKDPASGQQAEVSLYNKSYAVIIGIDQYQNLPADRQLSYAVKDAKGVAQALAKNYRFDKIFTLYNKDATKEQIMKLLTVQLPKEIGKNDSLFVFWAGHGNQELTPEGEIGFLIPYDGSADEVYRNVTMTEIRDTISRIVPAKHVFYAMDACYSGLLTTRAVDSKPRRDLAYLKEITKERVRQVLTAGARDQQVLDGGPSGHSVFTGRLIEILEASGDFITANEIQAILKERVFNDAKGRGYVQTPSFGSLSGNGDFVFVPNIQQKVQDNKAELARLEAELKQLEVRESEAKRKQNEQQLRDAEQARKTVEERVKAEQLRQQRLVEEQQRIDAETKERKRLQSLKLEDEKRLAALKADLEKRKQNLQLSGASSSIESAVAEIKKLHTRMQEIESTLERELAPTRQQVLLRYSQKIADLDRQQQSEFETRQEYTDRIQKQKDDLQALRDKELASLDVRTLTEQQVTPLKEQILKLARQEYSIPSEQLLAQLGKYDAEKQVFPVQIATKPGQGTQLASASIVKIPKKEAPDFKKLFEAGLIRFEMSSKISKDNTPIVVTTVLHDPNGKQYELPFIDSVTGMEFSYVKGGCFKMGSAPGAEDEKPVHEVCVDDFFMGRTEVTQGQWKKIMGTNPSYFKSCGDNCPVENVSWDDTQNFLEKLNAITGRQKYQANNPVWERLSGRIYRLPTEAEWEYAARGAGMYDDLEAMGKEIELTRKGFSVCDGFKKGEILGKVERATCKDPLLRGEALTAVLREKSDDYLQTVKYFAWLHNNSNDKTHQVASKPYQNRLYLYDMLGNVREWVQDCMPRDCSNERILKGGAWFDDPSNVSPIRRYVANRDVVQEQNGFRVILPAGAANYKSTLIDYKVISAPAKATTRSGVASLNTRRLASKTVNNNLINDDLINGAIEGFYISLIDSNRFDKVIKNCSSSFDFEITPIIESIEVLKNYDYIDRERGILVTKVRVKYETNNNKLNTKSYFMTENYMESYVVFKNFPQIAIAENIKRVLAVTLNAAAGKISTDL